MVPTTGLYHGLVLKCILCHLWVENFHMDAWSSLWYS